LPLTYFNIVAKGVMLRGADLSDLLVPLALLTLLGLMIFGLAVVAFSRQLRPARTRVAS
jgi:ABC-2 type transport system permease protein